MRTLQEKYNAIQGGAFSRDHFLAEARMQQPQLITRFNGYDDAVQILKNRGMIQEAKVDTETLKDVLRGGKKIATGVRFLNAKDYKDGNKTGTLEKGDQVLDSKETVNEAKLTKKSLTDYRYKPTNDMDKYPYEQILRGLRVELEAAGVLGTPTPEEYSKALAKVSKNLAKDSIFYTNQVAGVNPKVDLHDKMVTATAKNTVDTFNGMKKAALKEGFKKLIKKVLSSNLQEGYQAGDKVTFVDSNGGKPTSGVVIQDLGQGNFTFKASQDGKTYSTKGLDRGRWKIEKQVAEAMGDMFGDEERGERAANYGQPGESEYEFYSDPENYNEAEEEFDLQGEDEIDYDDENFSDPFIDRDLDESRMGDIYITAQDSDSFRDFLIAVKKEYPATNLRRDIEELKYIWDNRGGEDDSADDISHPRGYEEASDEETEQDLYEAKKSLSELLK